MKESEEVDIYQEVEVRKKQETIVFSEVWAK